MKRVPTDLVLLTPPYTSRPQPKLCLLLPLPLPLPLRCRRAPGAAVPTAAVPVDLPSPATVRGVRP